MIAYCSLSRALFENSECQPVELPTIIHLCLSGLDKTGTNFENSLQFTHVCLYGCTKSVPAMIDHTELSENKKKTARSNHFREKTLIVERWEKFST